RLSFRLRRRVEHDRSEIDSRDPVDEAMVGLGEQGEPLRLVGGRSAPLESLHEPDLPKRLGSIQLLRENTPGQTFQLLLVAVWRERRCPNVIFDVEVRVVDPDRATLVEWDEAELLPVTRHERKPVLDVP